MVRTTSKVLRAGRIAPCARSPLMRRADRFEHALRLVLLLLAVAAIAVAVVAGMRQQQTDAARIRAENAAKTPVPAVIVTDPVRTPAPTGMYADQMQAEAQWIRDGQQHRVTVDVVETAVPGEQVTVWLAPGGAVTGPPVADDAAVASGIATGIAVLLACWGLAYVLARATGYGLDRHRATEWGREWRQLEPGVGI